MNGDEVVPDCGGHMDDALEGKRRAEEERLRARTQELQDQTRALSRERYGIPRTETDNALQALIDGPMSVRPIGRSRRSS